jgi:hypothetical protein
MAGEIHLIAGAPISWRAYRLPLTPISSCEAEYVAGTHAAQTDMFLRDVLEFILVKQVAATVLFCDNAAAVMLSDGNTSSKRLKHISTRIAFLREVRDQGHIVLYHIRTTGQLADIFTKPLGASIFHPLRQLVISADAHA